MLPAPKALAFMKDPMAIGVGQKARAAVTDTGTAGQIEYEIDDESILSITNDVMTGLAVGSTHVTAMTYNGLTAECDVTVNPAPEYVKLPNANGLILGVNETCQLTPDSGGRTDQYAYSSSKAKYVKVSETGEIKALKAGTAVITVKTYNNLSCSLTVTVMKAPTSVTASPRSHNMGVGDQFTLGYTFPKKTGGSVRFESSDPGILLVDSETGLVKAVGAGEADVKVTTYNKHSDVCHVKVFKAPTSITLASDLIELAAGEVFDLSPVLSEGSWSEITYESKDPSVARVSGDGKVTGVAYGTTEIVASTSEPSVYAIAFVQVWDAPSSVKLSETSKTLNVDDVYQINPIIPDGSRTTFTYNSGNKKVAVVDDGGVVHALARGSAVITVSTHNNKQAVLKLQVLDPYMPDSITLTEEPPSLKEGATYQVKYKVLPATADAKLLWFSSDESVATVSDSGLVKAVGTGYATITAVSQKDESLSISVSIAVGTDKLTLVIPARTTDEKGIKANLAKIDAIRKSAIYEIDRLASKGVISSSDATKRRAMVNNIFKNYAFPWKTLKLQKYWKAANSEGGVKDFKTDRVYYGLPYISGSGDNRHYDVALALKENRYYDSDKGYYILNQNKLLGGKYVGNDCSGLVNVSIWGTSSSRASDRTSDIASSKYYRTISDWSSMRPGDLICKGNAHVVMFLYYTNAEKTKIMMIENGGAEPGTNTVHCDIYNLSYYQGGKYKVRRLSTLG